MALPESDFISEKEYLALDADSDIRYEYLDGEIFAMAGASREHNIIASNTHIALGTQLRDKPCEIYQSDMRVQTKADKSYRYPDIVVVCDEPNFADTTPVSLKNPTLIIEVLSKSTSDNDESKKADEFRKMPSVQEYVIISQDSPRIQRYYRQDDINWLYTDVSGIDKQLILKSIDCVLDLGEVFRRIEFDEEED
ncbi:MAG: Uma2 family endonuclease [Chloroflexota bacterium]